MRSRLLLVLGIIAALTVPSARATAHEIDVTTAMISLRDDHVQADVQFDLLVLLAATAPAWPGRAALSRLDDQELATMLADARLAIEQQSRLTVDGVPVALMLRHFPTVDELRAIADRPDAPASGHLHRETRLRFETAGAQADGSALGFQLPASLGSVLYTFVQPSTRMASPGASVAFAISRTEGQTERGSGEPAPGMDRLRTVVAGAAVLLASIALVLQWRARRANTSRPSGA